MCICVSSEQEAGHQGAEQEGEEAGTQGHEVQLRADTALQEDLGGTPQVREYISVANKPTTMHSLHYLLAGWLLLRHKARNVNPV